MACSDKNHAMCRIQFYKWQIARRRTIKPQVSSTKAGGTIMAKCRQVHVPDWNWSFKNQQGRTVRHCNYKNMKTDHRSIVLGLSSGIFLAAMAGCAERPLDSASTATNDDNSNRVMAQTQTNGINSDADNSAKNDRDRSGNTLTAGDQGNSPADRDLTQQVRKSLVGDSNLSITAKNIKIITINGKVTLRGPVNSETEKSSILTLAKGLAGDANVDDQLEVKSNP